MAALGWLLNLDFAGSAEPAVTEIQADVYASAQVTADLTTAIHMKADVSAVGLVSALLRTPGNTALVIIHNVPHIEDVETYEAVLDIHAAIDSLSEVAEDHKILFDADREIVIRTENFNQLDIEGTVLIDASSNAVQGTLLSAAGYKGRKFVFKCIDATFTASIIPQGGNNLDGSTGAKTFVLYETVIIQSDGTDWWIIST